MSNKKIHRSQKTMIQRYSILFSILALCTIVFFTHHIHNHKRKLHRIKTRLKGRQSGIEINITKIQQQQQISKMVMIDEMSYSTVSTCLGSWEALRRKPNYAEELGRILFIKFFTLKPEAKAIFGFDTKTMKTDDDFFNSPRFLAHGKHFVLILNKAVDMIGPNLDMLTEILLELGEVHKSKYGVKTEWFPIMGVALLECMADMLGPKIFNSKTKGCWLEVYKALTDIMIAGYGTKDGKKIIVG